MEKQIRQFLKTLESSPDNEEAFQALESAYTENERWGELADLYTARAQRTEYAEKASDFWLLAAAVYGEKMLSPEQEDECLRKVLDRDPQNEEIYARLKTAYAEREDWEKLLALLQSLLERIEEPSRRAGALLDLAGIYKSAFHDEERQISFLKSALDADPDHPAALEKMKAHYFNTLHGEPAAALLERQAALIEGDEEKGNLYLEAGLALADNPFERVLATEILQKASDLLGGTKDIKKTLKELNGLEKTWKKRLTKSDEEALTQPDNLAAAAAYRNSAGLRCAFSPDETSEILNGLEKSLAMDPQNRQALAMADRLLSEREDWSALAEFLGKVIEQIPDGAVKEAATARAARLYLEKLERAEDADAMYRRLFETNPDHLTAYRRLTERLKESGDEDGLRAILEDRLKRSREYRGKIDANLQLAGIKKDAGDDPRDIIPHYQAVLDLEPQNAEAVRNLVELYRDEEEFDKLLDLYPLLIAATKDRGNRREAELGFAKLLEKEFGRNEEAFRHYAEAFLLDPTDEDTLGVLEDLAIELDGWERLVDRLRYLIYREERPENWRDLLFKLGQIYDRELSQIDEAEACYRELFEDEATLDTLDALERLYAKNERWERLLEILDKKAEMALDAEERRDILLEKARVIEEEVKDEEAAIAAYFKVIEAAPDEIEAYRRLSARLEKAERFDELARIIEQQLGAITSIPEKVALYDRLGDLFLNRLDDREAAAMAYLDGVKLDPAHLPAIERLETFLEEDILPNEIFQGLESYYHNLEKWDKLNDGYVALLRSEEDPQKRGELCHKLAGLNLEQRMLPEQAYAWVQKGLEIPYASVKFLMRALEISRKLDKQPELLETLENKADSLEDPEKRARFAVALGRLYWDGMQDGENAELQYLSATEAAPEDVEVLREAADFMEQMENWTDWAEMTDKLADLSKQPERKRERLLLLADVAENKLFDNEKALAAWRKLLEMDDRDKPARDAVLRLLRELERWEDLAAELEERVRVSDDKEERLDLKVRLADLNEEQLKDPVRATSLYREVLEEDAHDARAFEALERLFERGMGGLEVAAVLRPLYEEQQEHQKLVKTLIVEHEQAEGEEAIRQARRIARMYEEDLNDAPQAFKWFGKAFLSDEGIAALKDLLRTAIATGSDGEFIEFCDLKLARDLKDKHRVQILFTAAEMEKDRLDRPEEARARYQAILDVDAANEAALGALVDLSRESGDDHALADLMERKLAASTEKSARREVALELALHNYRRLDNPEAALELLGGLLEERENDPEVFEKMEEILHAGERYGELYDLLERKLKYLREDDDILPVKIQMGSLLENNLERLDEAVEIYLDLARNYTNSPVVGALVGRLLSQDSTSLLFAEEMEEKYIKAQDWKRLVQVYEIKLKNADSPAQKATLLEKISGIYGELQDNEKAFEGFARVFADDPSNDAALDELEKLAGELGWWRPLADACAHAAENAEDLERSSELFIKAALLTEDILAEPENAIGAYRRVFDRDPNNETAVEAVESICNRIERWEDLYRTYLQRAEHVEETEEKIALYRKTCAVFEEKLDDPVGAIPYYEKIHELSPDDLEPIDTLLGLYDTSGDWENKALFLEKKVAFMDDMVVRHALLVAKAELHEAYLNQSAESKDIYKRILDENEDNERALQTLESYVEREEFQEELARYLAPFYERREDWDRLVDMREYIFIHSTDRDERLELLQSIAVLWEERLSGPMLAFGVYTRAFRERPDVFDVQDHLERLAATLGQFEQLATLFDEKIGQLSAEEEADLIVAIRMRAAALAETHLQRVEDSAEHYRQVLVLDAQHLEALDNLERIYNVERQWPELVDILERKFALSEDLETRKDLLFKIATLFEEEMADNAASIDTYRRILVLDDTDREALKALVRLTANEERWEELHGVRLRQLELARDEEEAWDLRHEIGLVLWQQLDRIPEAIEGFASILEENRQYVATREALEELLRIPEAELAAAKVLEPIYEVEGRFDPMIRTLDIQANHAPTPEDRRDLYLRMTHIAESMLFDANRAFSSALSAFDSDAANPDIRTLLERLAEDSGRWMDAASAYRSMVDRVDDMALQTALLLGAGRIVLEKLDDPAGAEPDFELVETLDPENGPALDNLQRIHERLEDWEKLVRVLKRKAELAAEPAAKIALLSSAAEVLEYRMVDQPAAVAAFLEVLDVDPEHGPGLAELDRLYLDLEHYEELDGILDRRIAITEDGAPRHDLEFRKGRLLEEHLDRSQQSLGIYRNILIEDDEHARTLEALERMVAETGFRGEALAILSPILEDKGWWQRLADLLETYAAAMAGEEEQKSTWARLKLVYEEKLDNPVQAFDVARRILRDDFRSENARKEMERLATATGGYDGLVDTYRELFEEVEEQDIRLEFLMKIARICENQLHEDERAIDAYTQILDIDEKHFTAMAALDRLYERTERFADLVELIPREFAMFDDRQEILEQRLRLGGLWEEKLGDNLTAIDMFGQVLHEEPENAAALAALERLYENEEMWDQLVDIYKAEIRIARGDTKKARLYARMADVIDRRLGQPREAIPIWKRVLQFDDRNEALMEKLENLYEREEMWSDLIGHLKKRLRGARGAAERAGIVKKMALVHLDHLGQEDQAAQLLLKVLEYSPEDMETVDRLEQLYQKNQSWAKLAELLQRLAPRLQGADLRALNLRLVALRLGYLRDRAGAENLTRQLLAADPTAVEVARLEELFGATDSHRLYLEILDRQALLAEEDATKVAIHFRMAEIWRDRIGDNESTKLSYEKVLEIQPKNLQAAELLEDYYRTSGEWEKLIGVLRVRMEEAELPERCIMLRQTAEIQEEKLGEFSAAYDALAELFRIEFDDASLLEKLGQLSADTERHADFVELLSGLIPQVEEEERLFKAFTLRIANILERKLDRLDEAADYYKAFLGTKTFDDHAVEFLIAYHESRDEWAELVGAYQMKIPYMNQEEKVAVGCRVAEIFNTRLEQTDRAVKTYYQVLKMDDRCEPAVDALIGIFEARGDWKPLAEMLRKKMHLVSDPAEISRLRLRIAALYRTELGDLQQAKTFYRSVVADDPQCGEALEALEGIYSEEENYDELLEILSRRVNVSEATEEKVSLYRKMAMIWLEKFVQPDMAVSYLEKALDLEPADLKSLETLERVYREAEDWPALASAYQRHLDQSIDADEIVGLCVKLGRIHGEFMFQPTQAVEFFNKALKIDETYVDAWQALADLYAAHEQWERAITTLERIADLSPDMKKKVAALAHVGRIHLEQLSDRESAKAVYDRMLALDPTFVPALQALRKYYAAVEDWPKFLETLAQEKQYVEDAEERGRLMYEEGRYYEEKENDLDQAIIIYREALSHAPDHLKLLQRLGRIHFEREHWDEAREILLHHLDVAADMPPAEKGLLHHKVATIAELQQNDNEALHHYTTAYKIDSNNLATLEGLSRTLERRGDWERAFRVTQTILARFRSKKSGSEIVELFCRLGRLNAKLGKIEASVRMFDKALERDPRSVLALTDLVNIYESLEMWKKALQNRAKLIKLVKDDDLFEQWKAVGEIYAEKLDNLEKGLEAYRHALEIKANDPALLTRLADLLLRSGNMEDAIGVLRGALELEEDDGRRLELNIHLGDLIMENGANPKDCLEYFNAALDIDPSRDDLFRKIEDFLMKREDWDELDSNYRLMITRIPQEDTDRWLGMWKKLGRLLANRDEYLDDAVQVWEVISRYDADNPATTEIMADLYLRSPKYQDKARQLYHSVLQQDPERVDAYRALWKIHFGAEEFDRAFIFASVADYLGGEGHPAAEFYRDNKHELKAEAIGTISRESWAGALLHPDARHSIGQILNILYHHIGGVMPSDLRQEGLKKKNRLDLSEHINICTTTVDILKTLNLPTPEIYMKQGYGPGVEPLAVQPMTLMIGADAFENFPQRELVFLMTSNAMLVRPDFLIPHMLSEGNVRALLDAAARLFDSGFQAAGNKAAVDELTKKIDKGLPKKVREPLGGFIGEYLESAKDLDIRRWRRALRLSAYRAGLLLCNDLATALKTLEKHPGRLTEEERAETVRELIAFFISPEYYRCRKELNLGIL